VRPDPRSTIEFQEGAEDEGVLRTVELADLHAALERLSEGDREILEMRYEEDLTHPVIASKLGIPEGTVKVRLHRAREKLRLLYAGATVVP
jgi:RNA polymerase sigma-70 factor (ECF subfamily)